jgi:hypothetical protein
LLARVWIGGYAWVGCTSGSTVPLGSQPRDRWPRGQRDLGAT